MRALNAKDEVNANMFTEWRQNLQETRGPRILKTKFTKWRPGTSRTTDRE